MEALEITNAKMAELGMPDFGPEFTVSCENHGGSGLGKVQQWNAAEGTWDVITDWIAADREIVDPLIEEDSMA